MPDPSKTTPPGSALKRLIDVLTLERLEDNLFRGQRACDGWQRVYGGQVLGQALSAMTMTVAPERSLHSLHGYFLLAGDPDHDIIYDVERIRDGGSFATRRARAIQHGRTIFSMSASFHVTEPGFEHQSEAPQVPPPDALPSIKQLAEKMMSQLPDTMKSYWNRELPLDIRIVDPTRYASRDPRPPQQAIWVRANGKLPDSPPVHQAVLAYASDFTLLDTALIAHGKVLFDRDMQLASLDHAMWFHRDFRADDWLLYAQESPSASGARGYCRGAIYDQQGRLVASTVQEGLMRQRSR